MSEEKRPYRPHSVEFKAEAVRMVQELGERQAEVARKLGISKSLLGNWLGQSQGRKSKDKEQSGDSERIRALERELRKAQMERDILKKAVAFFAKENP